MNHHFVPQFYFRRFSRDGGSIEGLHIATGAHRARASIRGQASKSNFYLSDEIEKLLQDEDGRHAAALRRIAASSPNNPITPVDDYALLTFVTLQHARTGARRNRIADANSDLVREFLRCELLNAPGDPNRDLLLEHIDQVKFGPGQTHMHELAIFAQTAILLEDLMVCLLRNRTDLPFCFSDTPVVLCNPYLQSIRTRGTTGYQLPGLQVYVPIGPDKAILLFDPEIYKVRGQYIDVTERRDSVHLNKVQIHSAESMIYFRSPMEYRALRTLWRQEHGRRQSLDTHFNIAPGFDSATGKPLGEFIHSFESQIAFMPNLSFVQYTPVRESEYQFRHRSPHLIEAYKQQCDDLFAE